MTSISTRNSILAVVPEVTQNLLRVPQSAADYVPLQDDLSIETNNDEVENLEITASIGKAPPIVGGENPSVSLSFYLKGSGVEGQAPQWNEIAKSFFGTQTTEGTQRVTAASSTTSIVKLTSASSLVSQGYGMLIKDPINGYRVRVVHSVVTNDITPSFNLPAAPGTAVGLGKPVFWSPANSGHQSLSLLWYGGNGGVLQAVAGNLVNDFSFSATANDSVNATAGFEGLSAFINPIEITAATSYIDWTDDTGTLAAAISAKWYKDPHEVAEALQTAMNAAGGETFTVSYSDTTGKFTILCTGTLLSLLWNTGTNAANSIGTKIGFLVAANDTGTGATTGYPSDNVIDIDAPHTPTFDATQPNIAKNQEIMIGDQTDYACFNASEVSVSGTNTVRKLEDICSESGRNGAQVNEREFEITVTAVLNKYDVKQFARYRNGSTIRFQCTIGAKSGGNWVAGTVCYAYAPTCKISSLSISDDDGLVSLSMTMKPFPSAGSGEFYLGQL